MCPAVGSGSSLFWELCSGGSGLFPHPGLRFHARTPLPHAVIRGLPPPRRRWQPLKRSRTALVDRAGQQPRQQLPGSVGSGSPAARCVLRSPASVESAGLPNSSLGAWALTGDPCPRESEGSLSLHFKETVTCSRLRASFPGSESPTLGLAS